MQLWANVRPVKNFPNVPSPLPNVKDGDIDWVLVRENSEGESIADRVGVHTAVNLGRLRPSFLFLHV